jgi:hypothetical protein
VCEVVLYYIVKPKMSLRPNARVEVRKKGYKLAVDADEARRKREDGMVEIRKSKRDENLLKKRREGTPAQHLPIAPQTVSVEKKVRNKPRSKKEEMVAALRVSFFLFLFSGTSGSDRPGSFCRLAWIMLIF